MNDIRNQVLSDADKVYNCRDLLFKGKREEEVEVIIPTWMSGAGFTKAAKDGDLRLVKHIIEISEGIMVTDFEEAIRLAKENGHTEVAEFLSSIAVDCPKRTLVKN